MDFAKDTGQGLGLRWSGMVFRGRNLKIVSRISPEIDRRSRGSCCVADWPLRCTLLAFADELREAMAEPRLRGSPPTRCAIFLNAASSAVAVYVALFRSISSSSLRWLIWSHWRVLLAGCERVRGWDSNPGPADYESARPGPRPSPLIPSHPFVPRQVGVGVPSQPFPSPADPGRPFYSCSSRNGCAMTAEHSVPGPGMWLVPRFVDANAGIGQTAHGGPMSTTQGG